MAKGDALQELHADVRNRRTWGRLRCEFGKGCHWWVTSSDAAHLSLAWLNHARTAHWNLDALEELP